MSQTRPPQARSPGSPLSSSGLGAGSVYYHGPDPQPKGDLERERAEPEVPTGLTLLCGSEHSVTEGTW